MASTVLERTIVPIGHPVLLRTDWPPKLAICFGGQSVLGGHL